MTQDRNAADVAFIKALAELLNENGLSEIAVTREYDENDALKVRVSKHPPMTMAAAPAQMVSAPAPVGQAAPVAPAAPGVPAASSDPADLPGCVTSPMVGTAYLSPEPGASAFVTVGQQVNAGQTLMIIEAMKTMNHIPAPHSGTVKRIMVTDGTPVEYGAPLMIVE
jgi:acetyl-CoA carboxylase biotin carboxyl carrier protein